MKCDLLRAETQHELDEARWLKAEAETRALRERLAAACDALATICNGQQCETYTGTRYCRSLHSGRRRDARYGAERWCDTCIARDALEAIVRAATTDLTPQTENDR